MNYKNLEYFTTIKNFNKQQIRYMKFLKKFNFIIYYVPKQENK